MRPNYYPFFVAEMGANHNQWLPRALALVDAAAEAGANAIKLQTYTADGMVCRGTYHVIEGGEWGGMNLWELYERGAMPWSWHKAIFKRGAEKGIIVFSTPFERDAIPFLERLGCPMYKIASAEILDLNLIKDCAGTGKPLVISTGMASLAEIEDAVRVASGPLSLDQVTLLKCTSGYPAPAAEANLETINNLRRHFRCKVGLSDHTVGSAVAIAAGLYDVDMIEKHLTLRRADGGLDASFSAEPEELKQLIADVHTAMDAVGEEHFGPTASEMATFRLRRTLHVVYPLKAGELFSEHNVKPLRPGDGLPPAELYLFIGRPATRAVAAGEPLAWDMVRGKPRPPRGIEW